MMPQPFTSFLKSIFVMELYLRKRRRVISIICQSGRSIDLNRSSPHDLVHGLNCLVEVVALFGRICATFVAFLFSVGAIIHGSSMPVFFLLFGEMVNGFGKNQMDLPKMTHEVSKYALYFVYLGLIVCISSYGEIACWMYSGEIQVGFIEEEILGSGAETICGILLHRRKNRGNCI